MGSKRKKRINRSVLLAGAKVLELYTSDEYDTHPLSEMRKIVFAIMSRDQMKEFEDFCNAPIDYIINEDC